MHRIMGIERLEETVVRLGGIGDNWHMTWAGNDKQYVALCDGRGWPGIAGYTGQPYNARVYAINGNPPHLSFEHLPGFPDLLVEEAPHVNRYYGFGILALDGRIYHYLSTPNRPFAEPDARFVGAKLIYSPDEGRTWRNQDGSPIHWETWDERGRERMVFFEEPGEAFSLLTVLQMGRDYADNKDGFVYLYAPNGNTERTMNQMVLCRVRKERLLDRAAYEFFAARRADGSAEWTPDITHRDIVHTFPAGWVNRRIHPYAWHPSIVYYAPTHEYLMANWGMGCDEQADEWFAKPSYLGFWTAPNPWGPWRQIHEETTWTPAMDANARAYQPQIAPKWIAADGRSFWLVWTDYQLVGEKRPYYAFNVQKVEVGMG